MEITNITFHQFIVFFIGFVRIGTIIATVPILGYSSIPNMVKIGLAFFVSWVLFPMIETGEFTIPVDLIPFILMILKEVVVGLVIGLASNFLFVGIQMTGELVGLDMGFGIVNILDPQSGEQVSIMGQFQYVISLPVLFLSPMFQID